MGEPEFTTKQLEQIILGALKAHDMKGVVAALTVMAVQDPHSAQIMLDTLNLGIAISRSTRDAP